MASPLWSLDFGQIGAGLKRLGDQEITPEDWARLLADDKMLGQVAEAFKLGRDHPSLLEPTGDIRLEATNGDFCVEMFFKLNKEENGLPKISSIGDNFTTWFGRKVQKPIKAGTLCYHKLRESSVDGPIITALGGEAKAETTLSEMFSLMEKQKNGEDGCLLNNGYANIFHIKDQNGVLRAVSVYWDDDGWDVRAYSVDDPDRWGGGCQVFSRNSVLGSSEPVPAAN